MGTSFQHGLKNSKKPFPPILSSPGLALPGSWEKRQPLHSPSARSPPQPERGKRSLKKKKAPIERRAHWVGLLPDKKHDGKCAQLNHGKLVWLPSLQSGQDCEGLGHGSGHGCHQPVGAPKNAPEKPGGFKPAVPAGQGVRDGEASAPLPLFFLSVQREVPKELLLLGSKMKRVGAR